MNESRPKIDAIRLRVRSAVKPHLTPEQLAKLQELDERTQRKRRKKRLRF